MKSRTVCAAAIGLFLWYGVVAATECLPHPTEALAVNMGSTDADTTVLNSSTTEIRVEICIWSISPVRRDATLDVATVTFTGDATGIDTVATATILSRLRAAAVQGMIDEGYLTCTTAPGTVRIYHAGSITRSGSGLSTTFAASSESATKYYDLEYYYPVGESRPTIAEVGSGLVGGTIQ